MLVYHQVSENLLYNTTPYTKHLIMEHQVKHFQGQELEPRRSSTVTFAVGFFLFVWGIFWLWFFVLVVFRWIFF